LILASTRAAESTGGERRRAAPPGAAAAERAWDLEGPDLAVLAPPLRDALRNAVERVMLDWESVVEHAASPDEAMSHASAITNAIRSSIAGSDADLGGVPHTQLSRRLLSLIRSAFIEEAASLPAAPAADELLTVLGAMERIARALEPDWAQHLADRLSGPDGLELVVEVAHDLRSPLTSILFLAETLQ